MTTDKHQQLINKAVDQNRLLNSEQIETKSINSLIYATKVAKSLNTAIKDMCPTCFEIIQQALSLQERNQKLIKVGSAVLLVPLLLTKTIYTRLRKNNENHDDTAEGGAEA